jgi:hypothetical protein
MPMNHYLSLFVAIVIGTVSSSLQAFEVIYDDYGADYYIIIDAGSNDGIQEGMTACASRDQEVIFCGKVARVKSSRAGVYAGPQYEAWIEHGINVYIKELPASERNIPPEKARFQDLKSKVAFQSEKRPFRWQTGAIITPTLPFQFHHPTFEIENRIKGKDALWVEGESVKQSLIGASFSVKGPLFRDFDQEYSFVWRYIRPIQSSTDFDPNNSQIYSAEQSSAKNYALSWTILSPLQKEKQRAMAFGIIGLGIDSTQVQYKSFIKNSSNESESTDLFSSKSNLIGLFAKLGLQFEYGFGAKRGSSRAGRIQVDIASLIPVYQRTKWTHGDDQLPNDVVQRGDAAKQFEDAAKVKGVTVGMEAGVGAGWKF